MGRTPDIKTKAVATRIPMADYIKILQNCNDKGISVSEYVAERLSFDFLENGGKIETGVLELKNKNEELIKEIDYLKGLIKSYNTTINSLKNENEKLLKELEQTD